MKCPEQLSFTHKKMVIGVPPACRQTGLPIKNKYYKLDETIKIIC